MEDHLKRALIEIYYAIAEFEQEKDSLLREGETRRAEDLETALGTARAAVDAALRLATYSLVDTPKASA
jgi:hypothetical protein